jgi:hypothetical protein
VGYTHQGWLTGDHAYLLMDDELDERNSGIPTRTLIWDVRDLDSPVFMSAYSGSTTAIDHNQYIVGNHAYQANYRAGLRTLDISGIAQGSLAEVGFFDVYPADDLPNFNGAWSVYPFFPSGTVVVSGIEQGLFILRPNLGEPNDPPVASLLEPTGSDVLSGTVPIRIMATDSEDPAGSLTVHWNVNGGPWQTAAWDGVEYSSSWATTSVLDGTHVVNARAIDSGLREGGDAASVTVANGSPEFTVDAVNVTIVAGNGNRNTGEALVTVRAGGRPLDGVTIEGTFSGDWSGGRSGTTGSDGRVLLTTPKVRGLGFVRFCVDSAAKPGWIWDAAGSTLCGDSEGNGGAFGTVAGHVTDAATGAGIAGAGVSTDTGASTTSDGTGNYAIGALAAGTYTISVTASGYQSASQSATAVANATTTLDFALTPAPAGGSGTIKGTVYDAAGVKLPGVTVQVVNGSSTLTNNGGKYTIQNVAAGGQLVVASKPGYLSQQEYVDVTAGGSVTLNFTLSAQ